MVELADVALARYRIAPYLQPTLMEEAPGLGPSVWLKLENTNRTHSFKVRGALNAMLALDEAARARGIVAASSGNHAQGVAYAARLLGLRSRIVMSVHTSERKLEGVRRLGGEAILHGETYNEAEAEARRLESELGLTFISPYNDANVIAGAGTVGLEIVDRLPNIERVIVPIGGGGLISGIATAIKGLRPNAEVIGVDAEYGPAVYNLLYGTHLADDHASLADALPGEIEAGSMTVDIIRQRVDRVVLVDEAAIAEAMRFYVREHGWIVEGGGSVGAAALLSGVIPRDERTTAVVVSGGNVSADTLTSVLNGEPRSTMPEPSEKG